MAPVEGTVEVGGGWLCRCSHGFSGAPFARFSDSATAKTFEGADTCKRRKQRLLQCLGPSFNVVHPAAP